MVRRRKATMILLNGDVLAWESTGGATETVHETVRKWTELEGARGGYPAYLIRRKYVQISCCLQWHLAQAVIDRRVERACEHFVRKIFGTKKKT